jgi:TonB family protein
VEHPSSSSPVGKVKPARLLTDLKPSYPPGALKARVEGTVLLAVEIRPDGRPHNIRVVRPRPFGLTWAAIHAVREWRYEPVRIVETGEAVTAATKITVNFHISR